MTVILEVEKGLLPVDKDKDRVLAMNRVDSGSSLATLYPTHEQG